MSRAAARRQLSRDGWLHLLLLVAPVLIASRLPRLPVPFVEIVALALFVAGLASLFLNLPRFSAYKHALIATERAFGSDDEAAAWITLREVRLRALRIAALPAWLAALAAPVGLEPVAQLLLVCGSLTLLLLYRVPRQLK